jgi:hypothetical protein
MSKMGAHEAPGRCLGPLVFWRHGRMCVSKPPAHRPATDPKRSRSGEVTRRKATGCSVFQCPPIAPSDGSWIGPVTVLSLRIFRRESGRKGSNPAPYAQRSGTRRSLYEVSEVPGRGEGWDAVLSVVRYAALPAECARKAEKDVVLEPRVSSRGGAEGRGGKRG